MKSKIFIGCSGFHYKEWKDVFYPEGLPQSKWFQYYCQQFNTLELNVTFYRFPTIKSLQKWYESSPVDFKFSVKAPRLITHYKKFSECENYLGDFYGSIYEGLQEKLGCVLFQLPPQIKYTEEMLMILTKILDPSFTNVIEFRDASWWNENVFLQLNKKNIAFSGASFPKLPDEVIKTTHALYYRLHGVPVLYKSAYAESFLDQKIKEIKKAKPEKAWIYFNNTWGTAAITNSNYLKGKLKKL
ncbi:MAG: DUF72 domain-containing protein [Ginsengibacter sp.]